MLGLSKKLSAVFHFAYSHIFDQLWVPTCLFCPDFQLARAFSFAGSCCLPCVCCRPNGGYGFGRRVRFWARFERWAFSVLSSWDISLSQVTRGAGEGIFCLLKKEDLPIYRRHEKQKLILGQKKENRKWAEVTSKPCVSVELFYTRLARSLLPTISAPVYSGCLSIFRVVGVAE